ncbi:Acyl-coenzyme A:6-aminopenicillanic acid acyl-transferase [Thalassoglobus neptunius]|uniref:Acyl-coenzyme A:6-aminopenicillanic acid acyl-transferase n=1 Tax=Thalassoglobus neptunius TaxID=1938619 RepID=A0A5C5X770_9PLAN|nr:C45 family peptidase [Thalassoglobus neptunius]TWT58191.1 Acyl-coenzyme A:6-aminopenicillanic acid acyl-transferase [Thalassoglobus neptunius]
MRHGQCVMWGVFFLTCFLITPLQAESPTTASSSLASDLVPLCRVLSGENQTTSLRLKLVPEIDGSPQDVTVELQSDADGNYRFSADHAEYAIEVRRQESATTILLPKHQKAIVGQGAVDGDDTLIAQGIVNRLVSIDSDWKKYVPLAQAADPNAIAFLLKTVAQIQPGAPPHSWRLGGENSLQFEEGGHLIKGTLENARFEFEISELEQSSALDLKSDSLKGSDFEVTEIPREELERTLSRGIRRATEILSPSPRLTHPPQDSRTVPHGELKWVHGHRVAILHGTPEEIGTAHGNLLKDEILKTVDSVMYTFGTVNMVRSGKWFRVELDEAYERLSPHIPKDHLRETVAMANAVGVDTELALVVNVFPELFHCSGFAIFGSATTDGKLYHGRVLDYMTTIGLQDAATTFIVSPNEKISFANVGYAGFIGSVTGINSQGISLGEMGGRGEGQWDGVPMATLMRRGLEECSSLAEVMDLFESSPRTCEYYYVFADGNRNEAVGVAATPEAIEFIRPGQSHERLGEGIEDCVVLSAGNRLTTLRERVIAQHGKIDTTAAIRLMDRPVAMESNLHNALFIPADGVLYVANADHDSPAAERPYVRLDLRELLTETVNSDLISEN